MKLQQSLFHRIVNYSLIGTLVIWILFGITVLLKTPFSLASIVLIIMFAVLAYSIKGILQFDRWSYLIVLVILLINIGIKLIAGMKVNVEVVPLLLLFYLLYEIVPKKK